MEFTSLPSLYKMSYKVGNQEIYSQNQKYKKSNLFIDPGFGHKIRNG